MRILQICNRVPWPPHDGGAIAMLNMTKAFQALGHEVHLLCLNTQKHFVKESDMPQLFHELASFRAVYIDTDVEAFGALSNLLFSKQSFHLTRFKSRAFSAKLIYVLKRFQFDVIQLEGLHISIYLPLIRKYSKAKVVLRAHNIEFLIWQRLAAAEKNPLKKWYVSILASRLKNYELNVINLFDALVPITTHDAETFQKLGCKVPIHVSSTGLDLEDYSIEPGSMEWPSVFHLGALDWLPNQQAIKWFLQEVWPKIQKQESHLKFYIAGRNIPEWIMQLKLPNVEVVGEVEDAKAFINSKAIMVVPLLSGSGMRIKIIEGMALAKAIVSTPVGAEGIQYTDGENVLIANNAGEFAAAVLQFVSDKQKSLQLGKNARKLVDECYTNNRLVEKLVNWYNTQL